MAWPRRTHKAAAKEPTTTSQRYSGRAAILAGACQGLLGLLQVMPGAS